MDCQCSLVAAGMALVELKRIKSTGIDSFYEAFNLNSLQPGSVVVVTTQSGMTIQIHRPKRKNDVAYM